VATVVLKLFNQVQADRAYFGQKDAQQVRVIGQMIRDLDVPIELIVCPTVREPDGLAMSSRNRYLDAGQRSRAIVLSQALNDAAALFAKGQRDPIILRQAMQTRIASVPEAKLDYAAIIDEDSFLEVAENQVLDKAGLLALAVKFGETRLIDNLPLREECERHG
jgi:pantoate--beta-alanine ligase